MVGLVDTVTALGLFTIVVVLWKNFFQLGPRRRLPPGPRPWPVLGNLPLMKGRSLAELSKELIATYGPIITLWIGSTSLVVISSPELVHSVFQKQGSKVMGRPRFESTAVVHNNSRGLVFSTGNRWKFLRRMAMLAIMSNARLAAFRPIRNRGIDALVDNLSKNVRDSEIAVLSVRFELRFTMFNILFDIIFKRSVDRQTFEIIDANLVERVKLAPGQLRDHLPFLRFFPDTKNVKFQKQLLSVTDEILYPILEERRKILSKYTAPEFLVCYMDHLLAVQSQFRTNSMAGKEVIDFTDKDIICHSTELLNAGIETTSAALEYALANIITHPRMQEKLFNEIESVVGRDRLMNDYDIPKLPYLQAFVYETLRRHPPTHMLLLRSVTSPGCQVAGYSIPVDTLITAHLEHISTNSKTWKNPSQFDPERFYNSGKNVDMTGKSEISFIPFGVGRRICPAMHFALLHIQLILGRLIQSFEWHSAIPGQLPDLTPAFNFGNPMKHPLQAILRVRGGKIL